MATRAEQVIASSLLVVGAFQAALAAGAPWGRAAYGGNHVGPLPRRLRAVSGVAAAVYLGGAVLVLDGTGTAATRSHAFTALGAFMGVGVLANGASRSPVERALWTPVTAVAAAAAWRARSAGR